MKCFQDSNPGFLVLNLLLIMSDNWNVYDFLMYFTDFTSKERYFV